MKARLAALLTHLYILRCAGTREVFLDLNQAVFCAVGLHRVI